MYRSFVLQLSLVTMTQKFILQGLYPNSIFPRCSLMQWRKIRWRNLKNLRKLHLYCSLSNTVCLNLWWFHHNMQRKCSFSSISYFAVSSFPSDNDNSNYNNNEDSNKYYHNHQYCLNFMLFLLSSWSRYLHCCPCSHFAGMVPSCFTEG